MSDKLISHTYWVDSVDAHTDFSCQKTVELKLAGRLYFFPDGLPPQRHQLVLKFDELQIDQLLCQLQILKKEMA